MFKKLVSNIPFNPSMIDHLPDLKLYLKKERRVRLIGLTILLLAFLGQLFITLYPPKSAVTSSPNDLIRGGFISKTEIYNYCYRNYNDYGAILAKFSISCNDILKSNNTSISSTSYNDQLFSLNRIAYGYSQETLVNIKKQDYWLRHLSDGSALNNVFLNALNGINKNGLSFYILYNSGNLVFINEPLITSNCGLTICPVLSINSRNGEISNANNTTVNNGDIIIYTLSATNLSKYKIKSYKLTNNFSSALSYFNLLNSYGGSIKGDNVSWPAEDISSNQTITKSISFIAKNSFSSSPLSSSDSNYLNMKSITVFGNSAIIKIPFSFSKYFELKINNSYPSMNKSSSLIIIIILIIYSGYFIYRNYIISKEVNKLKDDYLNGGEDE